MAIARRLAIAKTREKRYCQTSGNSIKSWKMPLPDVTWSKSSSGSILHIYYMYANNGDIAVVTGVGSCHFLEEIFELGSARPAPPLILLIVHFVNSRFIFFLHSTFLCCFVCWYAMQIKCVIF